MTHELSSGDQRCPFLALSVQQRAANGSKRRHKTKVENRRISRVVWCVSQHPAERRKGRLRLLFPPVNRRVVGSSPT